MPQGTTLLNFGAFPGVSDAVVTVIGQTSILAASLVESWIFPASTADHSADEHMLETIKVFAGNIVAGTGFTIYGFNTSQINEPLEFPGVARFWPTALVRGHMGNSRGGQGTRLYGAWNCGWAWN